MSTVIELVRKRTADLRNKGHKVTQAKVKEALAQAYGYRCYNAMYYDRNGMVPSSRFIKETFYRVLGLEGEA